MISLDLSTMKEVHQLHIASDVSLDCTSAAESWARIRNTPLITGPQDQHNNPAWQGFMCSSSSTSQTGLSNSTKLKIGLAMGLAVPVLLVLVYFIHRRFERRRAREIKPPAYEHELDDRYGHGEALPSYVPREIERAGTLSEVSSLSDADGIRRSLDEGQVSPHEGSIHEVGTAREQRL